MTDCAYCEIAERLPRLKAAWSMAPPGHGLTSGGAYRERLHVTFLRHGDAGSSVSLPLVLTGDAGDGVTTWSHVGPPLDMPDAPAIAFTLRSRADSGSNEIEADDMELSGQLTRLSGLPDGDDGPVTVTGWKVVEWNREPLEIVLAGEAAGDSDARTVVAVITE